MVFLKQETSGKFGLNSVQCLEIQSNDLNLDIISMSRLMTKINSYIQEKNTTHKYGKKLLYISTTCFGLFDQSSSFSSIMHINNRKLLQDGVSYLQILNKMILLKLLFQNVE